MLLSVCKGLVQSAVVSVGQVVRSQSLKPVSYSNFRLAVEQAGARKVRNKGKTTYLYDQHNRVIAILKTASMDAFGRIQPAQYYVRAA
jgi:hypothetical protein